jgi:diguanylate cyclase (GGDEF)-like protein/PAS domain S-box-containing protein
LTHFYRDADLQQSTEFFRQIVMESADAVVAVDHNRKIVFFSPAAEALFGYRCDEVLGNPLEMLLPVRFRSAHPGQLEQFHRDHDPSRYMGDRKSHVLGLRKDGSEVFLGATITKFQSGAEPYMVAILRDISKRITLQEELERLASVDPLTGALNRRAFLDGLSREWKRARRYRNSLSLLYFDLDHFKKVNDVYGHDAGDQVICRFAELAQSQLRDIDLFGRWGGEEFVATVVHADLRSLHEIAERIRRAFAGEIFEIDGFPPFSLTVSIGGADSAGRCSSAELIKLADGALYQAKNGGRNRVVILDESDIIPELAEAV